MKLNTRLVRNIVLALTLVSAVAGVGTAREAADDNFVVYGVISATEERDPLLQGIVERAIEIRFDALGTPVSALDVALTGEKPEKIVRQTGARFILSGSYEKNGEQGHIVFTWYDADSSEVTATSKKTGKFDIFFDEVIFSALDEIIADVSARIDEETLKSGTSAESSTGDNRAKPTDDLLRTDQDETQANAGSFSGSFQTRVSADAFIAVGRATDYLSIGGGLGADLTYGIRGETGILGFGIETGAVVFAAEGTLASSSNFLFPVGGVVSFQGIVGRTLGIAIDFSGGGVFFLADSSRSGLLYQVIPYGSAGVSFDIRLTDSMAVGMGSNFDVYVTLPDLIMGVSPALYVRFGR